MAAVVHQIGQNDESTERVYDMLRRSLGTKLCEILEAEDTLEVVLNEDGQLWVDRMGMDMAPFGEMAAGTAEHLLNVIAGFLRTTINAANPIIECELPLNGYRFEGVVQPVSRRPIFAIRRPASRVFTLTEMVAKGTMSEKWRIALEGHVARRSNILAAGGTSSGKTTFANAILNCISRVSPEHRLGIVEDARELQCESKNKFSLRTAPAADMTRLVNRVSMRMRPDRIIVGEVRGGEALALLKAWNTGHPGGVATVHANSAKAALSRLEQLVTEATGGTSLPTLIGEAVDVVVFLEKTATGRRVTEMVSVEKHDGRDYVLTPIEG